jgi:hypothetical protein
MCASGDIGFNALKILNKSHIDSMWEGSFWENGPNNGHICLILGTQEEGTTPNILVVYADG